MKQNNNRQLYGIESNGIFKLWNNEKVEYKKVEIII